MEMFNADSWFQDQTNESIGKTALGFIVKNYTYYTVKSIHFFYNENEVEIKVFCPPVQEAEVENAMHIKHDSILTVKKLRVCCFHNNAEVQLICNNKMNAIYSKKRKSISVKVEIKWDSDNNGIPAPAVKSSFNAIK